MEIWLYKERIPAFEKYKVKTDRTITASKMENMFPPEVQWPAQNFNHLHEQPTYFISVVLILTLLGVRDDLTVYGAWGYVGLRVVHSVVHSTVNNVMVRFTLFALSSITLLGLTIKAATVVF
jgi:hypothetical protein